MTFQHGAKQTLGLLDAIVTFQGSTELEPTDNLFSQKTLFVFSRLDWNEHAMEAQAGK